MRAKDTIKKTWDVDRTACEALEQIAQEESRNVTAVVNEALKYYADRYYLENKATMLPNDILAAMRSTVNLLEHRLDNRANQLLSSMAIQMFIVNRILGESLELTPEALEQYRVQAVEFIKANNRLLDLREVV